MIRLVGAIVIMTVVVACIVPARAEPSTQPSLAAENATLKARVAELEAKVQRLERQLARQQPIVPQPFSLAPRLERPVPRHWQPRTFNGITWYMVPLASDGAMGSDSPPIGYVVQPDRR